MHSSLVRLAWAMLCVTMTIVNFPFRPSISRSMAVVPGGVQRRARLVHQDHAWA